MTLLATATSAHPALASLNPPTACKSIWNSPSGNVPWGNPHPQIFASGLTLTVLILFWSLCLRSSLWNNLILWNSNGIWSILRCFIFAGEFKLLFWNTNVVNFIAPLCLMVHDHHGKQQGELHQSKVEKKQVLEIGSGQLEPAKLEPKWLRRIYWEDDNNIYIVRYWLYSDIVDYQQTILPELQSNI